MIDPEWTPEDKLRRLMVFCEYKIGTEALADIASFVGWDAIAIYAIENLQRQKLDLEREQK